MIMPLQRWILRKTSDCAQSVRPVARPVGTRPRPMYLSDWRLFTSSRYPVEGAVSPLSRCGTMCATLLEVRVESIMLRNLDGDRRSLPPDAMAAATCSAPVRVQKLLDWDELQPISPYEQ